MNSISTPGTVTTPGTGAGAGASSSTAIPANLRLLSRSSIKKVNRASPSKSNKEEDKVAQEEKQKQDSNVDAVVSTEDIDVGLTNMSISSVQQVDTEAQLVVTDVSPVAPHKDTWKEVYTPRNSHSTDEEESEAGAGAGTETPIADVARNIFADVASPPLVEENHNNNLDLTQTTTPATTPAATPGTTKSTPTSTRRPSNKEPTPRFNVKEKMAQDMSGAKGGSSHGSSQSSTSSSRGFMNPTRSSSNHLNKQSKEKIPVSKWEDGLRKSDNISKKIHSTLKDRNNAFMLKGKFAFM